MTWLFDALQPVLERARLLTPPALPDVPGLFRPTTRVDAVARALRMCGPDGAAIRYRLADHSGGRDPHAPDPASHWRSPVKGLALATCDCAGFVAWALGFDRYQPQHFSTYGGWVNCDSAIIDARTRREWFEEVDEPLAGDVVVFPSIDFDRDGDRDRVGHIGLVTSVSAQWEPGAFAELRVAHCSGGNDRRAARAILETTGIPWSGAATWRGTTRRAWAATFLRYRRFAPF